MRQNTEISRFTPWMLSVLRIVTAFLFMAHGSQKLFHFPPGAHAAASLSPLLLWAGILEFWGGLLLLLGLFTRVVAFLLAGQMAVAYFLRHAPRSFWPIVNMGESAVLYCFVFLYLAAVGGGLWSVDHWWHRRR
jgi:putative oxidoreductase